MNSTLAEKLGSFVAGAAEATFFPVVPDVVLTLIATRSGRAAREATACALAGALVGGALMWNWGRRDPNAAREFLDGVPAISPALIESVQQSIESHGLTSVLFGPMSGTPYKIYAVEWGARGESLAPLLAISVPARAGRFALTAGLSWTVACGLERATKRSRTWQLGLWALGWTLFYTLYWRRMGW